MYNPISLLDNRLGVSFFKIKKTPITINSINKAKYIVPTKKIAKLFTILPTIPVPRSPIIPINIIIIPTISLLY